MSEDPPKKRKRSPRLDPKAIRDEAAVVIHDAVIAQAGSMIATGQVLGDRADALLDRILRMEVMADGPLVAAIGLAMKRAGRLIDVKQENKEFRIAIVRAPSKGDGWNLPKI